MKYLAILLLLVGCAWGQEASWLLPDYSSSPAQFAEPGFGLGYYRLPSTDQRAAAVSGQWGDSWYGGRFVGAYETMDSVYRRIYTEWSASVNNGWAAVGVGYGLSMEWIPGDELWNSHLYKGGFTLAYRGLVFWAMAQNYFHEPIQNLTLVSGFLVKPGESFDAFAQWDGSSAFVGSSLNFKFVSLASFYRFPGFCVGLGVKFHLDLWNVGGSFEKSDHSLDWFSLNVKRKIKK